MVQLLGSGYILYVHYNKDESGCHKFSQYTPNE